VFLWRIIQKEETIEHVFKEWQQVAKIWFDSKALFASLEEKRREEKTKKKETSGRIKEV
jgi:hypothetical protein